MRRGAVLCKLFGHPQPQASGVCERCGQHLVVRKPRSFRGKMEGKG